MVFYHPICFVHGVRPVTVAASTYRTECEVCGRATDHFQPTDQDPWREVDMVDLPPLGDAYLDGVP
jgi:hypothetical protein